MTADAPSTPDADVHIDEALIAALLAEQHSDLAGLPIRIVEAGWDNVMARLGEDIAVRLPRRALSAPLIEVEQRWLPQLAPRLPVPTPAPLRVGEPGPGYPWRWSILPWLPGEAADLAPPNGDQAPVLADFLKALHQPAPADAPANRYRDCPLSGKTSWVGPGMAALERSGDLITLAIRALWARGLEAPVDAPRTWIAGDIHARNVLVENGRFSAFIDWGDMCAGDRATDLASIWALFEDAGARRAAIEAYGMTDATLARAKGWAVFYGVFLAYSGRKDNPRHVAMGEATLRRLHDDRV